MLHMSPRRAFWEAVATVCIPTLAIWGVLLYVVRANARSDEWPSYVIFIVLPLPLIFPIYRRYLKGPSVRNEGSPKTNFIAAIAFAALGLSYVVATLLHHRDNSDLVVKLVMGTAWLLIAGEKFRRGIRARKSLAGQQ
jgi:hypothetical protein